MAVPPIDAGVIQVPIWIDLSAVVVGALAGALHATRQRFDAVGVLTFALVMGLGGGIIRDVLLNRVPVALTEKPYLPTVAVAAVVGFFFAGLVARFDRLMLVMDAAALALFAVIGVEKALLVGLPALSAVLIGTVTATGGGAARDLLTGVPPEIVRRGPWNAGAALVGSTMYVVLHHFQTPRPVSEAVTIAVVLVLRLFSIWRGWETPMPVDLTPQLQRPLRYVRRRFGPEYGDPSDNRPGADRPPPSADPRKIL